MSFAKIGLTQRNTIGLWVSALVPDLACCVYIENKYISCLKKRVFLTDRFEKAEKILVDLKMINKNISYCSSYELNMFSEAISNDLIQKQILA